MFSDLSSFTHFHISDPSEMDSFLYHLSTLTIPQWLFLLRHFTEISINAMSGLSASSCLGILPLRLKRWAITLTTVFYFLFSGIHLSLSHDCSLSLFQSQEKNSPQSSQHDSISTGFDCRAGNNEVMHSALLKKQH